LESCEERERESERAGREGGKGGGGKRVGVRARTVCSRARTA
jgi:hypothetical protein